MNWGEIGTQVILSILGIVISGFGVVVTYLVNKYVNDAKLKNILTSLNTLVQNSVLEVYQTYVEALKKAGNFDAEAQKLALERCLTLIKANMPKNIETWLKANYSNIESYLKSLVEAQIGFLKNNAK